VQLIYKVHLILEDMQAILRRFSYWGRKCTPSRSYSSFLWFGCYRIEHVSWGDIQRELLF